MRALVFLGLLLSLPTGAANLLLIESYHAEYPWDQSYKAGIRAILGDKHQFHTFALNTKRLPKAQFKIQADSAWQRYLELKPDLVFLADDNALMLLHERFSQTQTPVVYLGINGNPRDYGIKHTGNITGVLERPLFKRSLLMAQAMLPTQPPHKFLLLFDSGYTSDTAVASIKKLNQNLMIGNNQIDIEQHQKFSSWQSSVSSARERGYDAVFVALYQTLQDDKQQTVDEQEVARWTHDNATVPHFGFWHFSVASEGNIGGYILDGNMHGRIAGTIAKQILAGKRPAEIFPKMDTSGAYLFSESGLKRWQLSLPERVREQAELVD
ncbi:ABC transporter substrate-binding protein [Shewanella algae]|uniref:ABC transporter substrate-binding protein n=1 Tax=Shewanella algae TaxID=38313 RepID=UPI001AAC637F|nr:hypothetical protein [Shewanella algae]MBO2618594.1 hypothetical protein [Shewanella algae]MBO2681799.1 hypothetical protein [Shewanella algae]